MARKFIDTVLEKRLEALEVALVFKASLANSDGFSDDLFDVEDIRGGEPLLRSYTGNEAVDKQKRLSSIFSIRKDAYADALTQEQQNIAFINYKDDAVFQGKRSRFGRALRGDVLVKVPVDAMSFFVNNEIRRYLEEQAAEPVNADKPRNLTLVFNLSEQGRREMEQDFHRNAPCFDGFHQVFE